MSDVSQIIRYRKRQDLVFNLVGLACTLFGVLALVVLLAALGIVAITGAVMIGGLRAFGWLQQVPDMLRENSPTSADTWRGMASRIRHLSGWRRADEEEAPQVEPEKPAAPPPPELPLGEIGMVAIQRLGDHEPEHRVAEELEALVGRQPAVLVRVRAVRQRLLEQSWRQVDAQRLTERVARFS